MKTDELIEVLEFASECCGCGCCCGKSQLHAKAKKLLDELTAKKDTESGKTDDHQ